MSAAAQGAVAGRVRRPGPLSAGDPSRPDTDGVFTGYASLFGVADLVGDVVLPGAFRASIARRGAAGVKLLYQHDAAEPLGRWLELREDERGLKVTGRIHAGIARGREVLSLVEAGILDGLSIGFRTVRARTDAKSGLRRVAEVDLWEISVVTFPMLPGARIAPPEARGFAGQGADLARRLRRMADGMTPRRAG